MGGAMILSYPIALALVPLALVVAALTCTTRGNRSLSALAVALVRVLTCACLAVALASPHIPSERPAQSLPVLLDISSSVGAGQGDALLSRARELGAALNVPITIFPFGKSPAQAGTESTAERFEGLRRAYEKLDTGTSDIGAALSELSQSAPPVALLLSDGYETTGSASTAAASLGATKVFPLTAPGESRDSALQISQLYVPLTVKAKKTAEIRATLTNGARRVQQGELEVRHGSSVVLKRQVAVEPGRDLLVTAQSDPNLEGLQTVTATLTWRDDEGPHSMTKTSWLSAERRSRVLLLSGSPDDDRFLSQILRSQAYELESSIVGSSALTAAPSQYRVVVINNVPANAIPESFMRALPSYVRDGGGLVMVGGNRSFGLGGYIGSPVEEVLPVQLVPPHTEKKRLNVAVQLIIDKSRSMAQDSRLEFAKAAAREVVASLKDDDYIGVIGFEDVAFIALPISRVSDVRATASDRISRLFPTNRTNLYPALEEGRRGLARVNAGRKHLIVLTDGQIPDQSPIYFELIRQLRVLGITVSTVLVGTDAPDAFLAEMANMGGGSFYQTNDPRNLPRIFLSDVKVASGERTLKEEPEIPVSLGPDGVSSTQIQTYPPLRGFVETLPRSGAKTELIVTPEEGRFPLLASWKVGTGRAIAFTSDANGRWSAPWIRWSGIQEFWSDLIDSAQPTPLEKPSSTQFDLRTWVEGGDLVVDLALYEEPSSNKITATISAPSGELRTLSFSPKTKGHYQARLPGATAGTYRATVSIGTQKLPEVAWTLSGELFGELQHRAPNLLLLEAIASKTGGRLNPSAEDLKPFMTQVLDKRDLSHYFLIAAFLLFVAELLLRELLRKRARNARIGPAAAPQSSTTQSAPRRAFMSR